MRSIIAVALVALLLAIGCNHLVPNQRQSVGAGAAANAPTPTVENLVDYLNRNAACVKPDQAVTCKNVMINIEAEYRIGIDCKMICQAPRHFRLTGVSLGQPVVEIGSNDKEFWFWCSKINPPYLYHCSYDALKQGTKVPFPFQPDMVLNALGLAPYDRNKKYTMRTVEGNRGRNETIELTEQALSPENKPIQKITVFNRHQVQQPTQPQVLAHIIKDDQGRVVCAANVRIAQQVDGINGPIIPRMVEFSWPEQKMKMEMRIENPSIIAMPPEKAATIFNRKDLNIQSVDLATQTVDGAGLQQAGGAMRSYRP